LAAAAGTAVDAGGDRELSEGKFAESNTFRELARIIQCAPKARITSGGRFHPESCRLIW